MKEVSVMMSLRNLFRVTQGSGSRFNRYYGGILRQGAGFPTADEARKDLSRYDRTVQPYTWMR